MPSPIQHYAKRILVIGCCGSGKTTFSIHMARTLNLPLLHLDRLYWLPNWRKRPQTEFDTLLQDELNKENWIIEGDYPRTFLHRFKHADTIIFLDINRWVCSWRIIKRWLFRETAQAENCSQKCDLTLLKYVLFDYPYNSRKSAYSAYSSKHSDKRWIIFQNSSEAWKWLNKQCKK